MRSAIRGDAPARRAIADIVGYTIIAELAVADTLAAA